MGSAETSVVVDPDTQIELTVPPYSTPDETILRAKHQREGALISIRVYPEYAADWPLWTLGDGDLANPDHLGLSPALTEGLKAWQHDWLQGVGPGLGWDNEKSMLDWMRRGDVLCEALTRELWTRADVIQDYRDQHMRDFDGA